MSHWAYHRDAYVTARAAANAGAHWQGWDELASHPTVAAALAAIDVAEAAIAHVADTLADKHNGVDE